MSLNFKDELDGNYCDNTEYKLHNYYTYLQVLDQGWLVELLEVILKVGNDHGIIM